MFNEVLISTVGRRELKGRAKAAVFSCKKNILHMIILVVRNILVIGMDWMLVARVKESRKYRW